MSKLSNPCKCGHNDFAVRAPSPQAPSYVATCHHCGAETRCRPTATPRQGRPSSPAEPQAATHVAPLWPSALPGLQEAFAREFERSGPDTSE